MAKESITENTWINDWVSVNQEQPSNDRPILLRFRKANGKKEYGIAHYIKDTWHEWDGHRHVEVHTHNRTLDSWKEIEKDRKDADVKSSSSIHLLTTTN